MSAVVTVEVCGRCAATADPDSRTLTCAHDWVEPAGAVVLGRRVLDASGLPCVRPLRLLRRLVGGHAHAMGPVDLEPGVTPGPTVPSSGRRALVTPGSSPGSPAGPIGLLLSNGERFAVRRAVVLGRSPEHLPGRSPAGQALLTWPDLSRQLATNHLLLERDGSELWVTDLGSATGTVAVAPDGTRRPLPPGVAVRADVGTVLELAGRSVTLVTGLDPTSRGDRA